LPHKRLGKPRLVSLIAAKVQLPAAPIEAAHCGHGRIPWNGWGGGSDRLGHAELLLSRALSVDPHLTFAREVHAELRGARWDYQGAAAEYSDWARDEPLNAEAWDGVCWALGYAWPRRLAEAERACVRAVDLDPNGEAKHMHWVRVLALQGKHAEAEKLQQQLERDVPGTDWVYWGRFVIAMEEGRPREALAALQAVSASSNLGMAGQAGALAQAGQIDEAFARLEAAMDAGFRDAADLRNSRCYEPLRKDPRFEKLLVKHGL
jgi:tetratricopeptide (TPR) repeat protein